MANYDRRVYEPSDEVRVFDGSEDDDDVEGSRLPLLIVLALLVLAMFGGVVWLAYTQGVQRGRGETPVLTAAAGPERVAPPQGSGGNVPYQGFKIYEQPAPADDEAADAAPPAPKPAPSPATELPPAFRPQAQAQPQAQSQTPPPAPTPAPVAKTVVTAPVPKPVPAAPVAAQPPKVAAMTAAPAKPAAQAAPPKSVAALIQQANGVPEPRSAASVAKTTPPPALKQAVIAPTAAASAPVSTTATGAPRQLGAPVPVAPKVAAATPAPAAKPAATGGGYVLQIGAYKSQTDAESAWKAYKSRHAGLLSGYSENIQQVQLGEKGTWYRLRVGGLSDREVAGALCDRLKAEGGACIPGR